MTRTPEKFQQPDLHRSTALWAMLFVLLLAAAASLFRLNAVSFWEDESWLAMAIRGGLADVWIFAAERGVHPPLYFYIAYFLRPLFGDGEFALRWMSGLFGLLGIAFTYRLGATLLSRRVGLYAALLASGSLFWLYFARLARQYTLFYLLAAALIWAYWRWRKNGDWRWLLAIALIQAAALYTHYFSAFLGMTLALHALFSLPWRRTLRLWGALLLAGLLLIPWLPAIFTQLNSDLGEGLFYGVPDVPRILQNYADRVTNAVTLLGGALALVGLWALRKHKQILLLFFLWIVATFAVVIFVNQTLFLWYIGRNLLYTLPALMILYGAGLSDLSRWRMGSAAAFSAALVWVLVGITGLSIFWPGT
ncbi:MAG: glycosyltransferase family 39 protein, partial [Anaerolineae bacterium]|nr:glycosyltransferase family 39 protein [Anaerolineae bacterium]